MRCAQLRPLDVANGPGIRTTVFVSGCTHHCPGCFNTEYQDFQHGTPWTQETTAALLEALSSPIVQGLTLLGGEPMQNLELISVLEDVRNAQPQKDIWIYSGYTFEEICQDPKRRQLLSLCDVLVDGRFIEAQKDLTLRFRGSRNQRILDIAASLERGCAVEYSL